MAKEPGDPIAQIKLAEGYFRISFLHFIIILLNLWKNLFIYELPNLLPIRSVTV